MPTIYLKADTDEELDEAIAHYLQEWHPAAYGTFVRNRSTDPDGTRTAEIWRGTTAD